MRGLEGTWKGETIVPGKIRAQGIDKVSDFYLRLKFNYQDGTFSGIFVGDSEAEDHESSEHGNVVGELLEHGEVSFEVRYSKFYFYKDQDEKEIATVDDNLNTRKVKAVYEHSGEKPDWLTNESREFVEDHINNMIAYSKQIKNSCKKYNMKYIDTSKEFKSSIEEALSYLLERHG